MALVVEVFGKIVQALKQGERTLNLEQLRQELGEDQCQSLLRALGVHGVFACPVSVVPVPLNYLWTTGTRFRVLALWATAEQSGAYGDHYQYCCDLLQYRDHLRQAAADFGRQLLMGGRPE